MFTVEEWKRRIVKFFVFRSYSGISYKITDEAELFRQFASNFERNTQTAYEELLDEEIIEEIKVNPKKFYALNFTKKAQEIESIIKNEPFEEKFLEFEKVLDSNEMDYKKYKVKVFKVDKLG